LFDIKENEMDLKLEESFAFEEKGNNESFRDVSF
jgi:hypothetical protein